THRAPPATSATQRRALFNSTATDGCAALVGARRRAFDRLAVAAHGIMNFDWNHHSLLIQSFASRQSCEHVADQAGDLPERQPRLDAGVRKLLRFGLRLPLEYEFDIARDLESQVSRG